MSRFFKASCRNSDGAKHPDEGRMVMLKQRRIAQTWKEGSIG